MSYERAWWVFILAIALGGCDLSGRDDALSQLQDTQGDGGSPLDDDEAVEEEQDDDRRTPQTDGQGGASSASDEPDDDSDDPDPPDDNDTSCNANPASGPSLSTDKVDLLFMVDNSGSMAEEQAALSAQFPLLIKMLTTGDLDGDGEAEAAAARDLHLGVVSSDMGLVGISDIMFCQGLGDDGVMQNEPRIAGCQSSYPRFLSYRDGINDPDQTAHDFSCIATLGTEGCGFEQPLEVTLKALWPSVDPMPNPDGSNRITFLGDTSGFGQLGHGDAENQGFLRNDPVMGTSLIAVVVVTDEEDCSSMTTRHFTPSTYLDPSDPEDAELRNQGLNTRCHFNPQNLYPVDRYIKGLQALRPHNEQRVVFGAIAGVPPELVSGDALDAVDFADPASRDGFYQGVFDHASMQQIVQDNGTPETADDSLRPSCDTASGRAYPPTRIVQVAQGFGEMGIVQSICQEDFGPAVRNIASTILNALDAPAPAPIVCEAE